MSQMQRAGRHYHAVSRTARECCHCTLNLTAIANADRSQLHRAVTTFARGSTDGMIVTPSMLALAHRELIATVAARHRLPAVYGFRYHVTVGGLLSYGPNSVDQFRRAAGYVDRILKGEKPADLPAQASSTIQNNSGLSHGTTGRLRGRLSVR